MLIPIGLVHAVEVAALEQANQAVVLLDVVVELQVVLGDLGGGVALRARVVGQNEDRELRIRALGGLEAVGIVGLLGLLRHVPREPRVEGQDAAAVRRPELRGAGLAGDDDRELDEVVGVADDDHVPARVAHRLQDARGCVDLAENLWLNLQHGAVRLDDLADHVGLVEGAAVGESRVGVEQLDRGHGHVALANAGEVHLARIDRQPERVELPLVRRDDTRDLGRQVDAGGRAEAVLLAPVAVPVDAEHGRRLVEERVARVPEAAVDVAHPETGTVPVADLESAEAEVARRANPGRDGDLLVGEDARARDELVGRAGRVLIADGVVDQRLLGIVEELLVGLPADALAEDVVVVAWQADHRLDLAVLRVHHDDDAALEAGGLHAPLHRLLRELLLVLVEREPERAPGDRRLICAENLDLAPGGVTLDRLESVRAAELLLVGGLDARAAEQVVRQVAAWLQVVELLAADRTRVSEHLREEGPVLVLSTRLDDDLDTRKVLPRLADEAGDLRGHVLGHTNGVVARARVRVDGDVDVGGIRADEVRDRLDDVGPA